MRKLRTDLKIPYGFSAFKTLLASCALCSATALAETPKTAMGMCYRTHGAGAAAANQGFDIVMTPHTYTYFDYRQGLDDLDVNARMRRYENAFLWLSDAMVVNIACNSTDPAVGLEMSLESSLFKCYSADTGLLVSQSMTGEKEIDGRVLRGILYDKLGVNEGMFFENYVAQALVSAGHELLFHSRSNPKMEIDFLIRRGIKICPIEVKSAACRRHASLDALIEKCRGKLGEKYVVCAEDFHEEDGITYLPFYMAHCL